MDSITTDDYTEQQARDRTARKEALVAARQALTSSPFSAGALAAPGIEDRLIALAQWVLDGSHSAPLLLLPVEDGEAQPAPHLHLDDDLSVTAYRAGSGGPTRIVDIDTNPDRDAPLAIHLNGRIIWQSSFDAARIEHG